MAQSQFNMIVVQEVEGILLVSRMPIIIFLNISKASLYSSLPHYHHHTHTHPNFYPYHLIYTAWFLLALGTDNQSDLNSFSHQNVTCRYIISSKTIGYIWFLLPCTPNLCPHFLTIPMLPLSLPDCKLVFPPLIPIVPYPFYVPFLQCHTSWKKANWLNQLYFKC